jgi:hypothetical protein
MSDSNTQRWSRLVWWCLLVGFFIGIGAGNVFQTYWTDAPGVVHVGVYILALLLMTVGGLAFAVPQFLPDALHRGRNEILQGLGAIFFFLPLSFSEVCREFFHQFGGFTGIPSGDRVVFTAFSANWATFAFSWLFDSLTFNASQVFGWVQTPIQATAWWSGLLIVGFSVVSDVILFGSVINLLRAGAARVTGRT